MIYEVFMLDIINYLAKQGLATNKDLFADLNEACSGLPKINYDQSCSDLSCNKCVELCPTQAISLTYDQDNKISPDLNLAKCIGCSQCIDNCPDKVFVKNLNTKTAVTQIEDLVLSKAKSIAKANIQPIVNKNFRPLFKKSLSIRVVSTGCNACDLEINATLNPMFDLERFGINIVASPRMADALLVTGPCGLAMHEAIKNTYAAMPNPKLVIACGTCACSGGLHYNGYFKTNGLCPLLDVDVFIPGCPPHPWSIIYGLMLAMGHEIIAAK